MKDGLTYACARVDNCAIAALGEPLLVGNARGDPQEMAERSFVSLRSFVEGFHVIARENEHMHGRLRIDVAKGDRALILVDNVCGNLARDDSAKEALLFRHNFLKNSEYRIQETEEFNRSYSVSRILYSVSCF